MNTVYDVFIVEAEVGELQRYAC